MVAITKVKFHSLSSLDIAGESQNILDTEYYGTMDKVLIDATIITSGEQVVLKVTYKE